MQVRYFISSLLSLGVFMMGCDVTSHNEETYDSFKDYDLVMLTKKAPPSYSTALLIKHKYTGISGCSSFREVLDLSDKTDYGTAYYINHQDSPVTMTVIGDDLDETIVIPSQSSKGFVWRKTAPFGSPNQQYRIKILSEPFATLEGYFTLAASTGSFDLSEQPSFLKTTLYHDYVIQKENNFYTTAILTEIQKYGSAFYTNLQATPATIIVQGQNDSKIVKVPPFARRSISWELLNVDRKSFMITIQCEEGHTLSGFLSIVRSDSYQV